MYSWERPYEGEAAEALWTHIRDHYDPNSNKIYAHFCSVIQSSGMGKSRTVDELGKEHFSIPINLRNARSTGYPAADHEVRDFLTTKDTEAGSYRRACCFVDALFQHTDHTLKMEFNSQWGIEEVAREFRIRMTEGQTMKEHNEFRSNFIDRWFKLRKENFGRYIITSPPLSPATNSKQDLSSSPVKEKATEDDYPLVILAFDEAHTLTNPNETGYATWSNLSVLRHVFRALYHFPLFALFLSTTVKISQFTSPEFKRITDGDLMLIQPFIALGFDTLAKKVALDGNWDLERMLACLSRRLPIQINPTNYVSQAAERKQSVLDIDVVFDSMETVASSEPLLSEAAYSIMARESFDPVKAFKSVLEGFAVHKGDHGEFIALLLLTLARDQAVGPPVKWRTHPECRFFDFASFVHGYLFSKSPSASGLENLQHEFPDAKMHFNHFIKLLDFKSVDKKCLSALMTRGARLTVFLKSGTKLAIDNLGLILYRISNDPHYTHIPEPKLFESMNPYDVGILKEGDAPVPVIRIIFALAAQTPSLHVIRHDPSPAYNAVVYDIWSAGLSSDFLKPIDPQTTDIWNDLLQASYSWKDIYKAAADEELRRSM
ncbi:hypothetical protein F5887DRAFT_1063857 [Amanita rubescens]|nr:hypothetical protein F5887DRAFT_1063857 [Amanita rubescens]